MDEREIERENVVLAGRYSVIKQGSRVKTKLKNVSGWTLPWSMMGGLAFSRGSMNPDEYHARAD